MGELCKEYNEITDYGKKDFSMTEDFENEIGDVFFTLLFIMNLSGIDPVCALERVLRKMEKRFNKRKGGSKR